MSIIIFLIILAVLVLVHEFGHFIVAKWSGIRVDEFGLGFPPRLLSWKPKKSETTYSINAIPFGGFVKIFGENPDEASISGPDSARSFVNKNRGIQAAVLVAGVTFNIIFAWLLISFGFMTGLPTPVEDYPAGTVRDAKLIITGVVPDGPAAHASLKAGDAIISLKSGADTTVNPSAEGLQAFIARHDSEKVTISFDRGTERMNIEVVPKKGIVSASRAGIGISMSLIGTLYLPPHLALIEGAKLTYNLGVSIVKGLYGFFSELIVGKASFGEVTGPVGLVGLVGDASKLGFIYLLSFTAIISLNLAVINLLPFPALDGGRLLFVIIEAIKRSPINPRVANLANTIGFALLLLLMLVVTYKDITKLF